MPLWQLNLSDMNICHIWGELGRILGLVAVYDWRVI